MTVMAHPVKDILLNPGIPLQIYTSPQLAAVSALVVPAMDGQISVRPPAQPDQIGEMGALRLLLPTYLPGLIQF